jgi:hypothetical protein
VGTSHGQLGDSGSGIFDLSGRVIGISVGKKDFKFSKPITSEGPTVAINYGEIADHYSDAKLISAEIVNDCLLELDDPKVS